MKLTNQQKSDQHKSFLKRIREGSIYRLGLGVHKIEKMKYSDDKDLRKAAAIIEYAKELETEKALAK